LVALYTVWYNLVNRHKANKLSSTMATGIADKLWEMKVLAETVVASLPQPGKRGPYQHSQEVTTMNIRILLAAGIICAVIGLAAGFTLYKVSRGNWTPFDALAWAVGGVVVAIQTE
jgi:hypothetical protein